MIRQLAAATLAAATLALLPAATSATAAPPHLTAAPVPLAAKKPPAPYARLTLTVTGGEVARRTAPVTLTCRPAGGTHPSAAQACAALERSRGDVFGLPPRQGVYCTADYRPVTAAATGHWGTRAINATRTFGNACQLGIAAGVIFASR